MKINQVLIESTGATVAFAFGRFNPAHQGHIEVWRAVEDAGANWFVGTNPNTIGPNDPLTFEQKSAWMAEIYPPISGHIVAQTSVLTLAAYIFKKLRKNERASVAYITDATDWAWSGKLLNQYNGVEGSHGYYKFAQITHQSSPRVSSATALRDAARANDKVAFYDASGTDPKLTVDGLSYFDTVKQAVEKYPVPVKRGKKVSESYYDSDDYYNAHQGGEYGKKNLSSTIGGAGGAGTKRDDILKGQSKHLLADPFSRTSGVVPGPESKQGQIHRIALPGEMGETVRVNFRNINNEIGQIHSIRNDLAKVWLDDYERFVVVPLDSLTPYDDIKESQGVAENQGDSLKFDALEKLIAIKQQIQQEIQQKQEADIASWKQDFEKNTVQKAKQQLSTTLQTTPVAQAGEKYNALKDRLVQLNVAIQKHKELNNLIDKIKKEYPVVADRVDSYYESILPYAKAGAKDNYKSLIAKLNSIDRELRSKFPRAVKDKQGVAEADSPAVAHTAKNLENPPKVMQHRAKRDIQRDKQWWNTQITGRDTDYDEWDEPKSKGSVKENASRMISAHDKNGFITVIVQAPDGTKKAITNDNPRYINQWLMRYDLQLPPSITNKFKQFSLNEFAPGDDSHGDEKSYLLQLADDLFQAIYIAKNKMAVKAVKDKIAAAGGDVKIVWNNNGSFNVVMYHPVHFKQGHLVSLVGDSDSQRMGESTNVQGPVEAWGYRYNERDQRVMWRLNFDSEQAAHKWADSKNATVVEVRPIKQLAEEEQQTVAKTWDQMTPQEKSSGVKGRTLWNEKTQRYYTVFDVPVNDKEVDEAASLKTMRDYFAGDKNARDPFEITKQRMHFIQSQDPEDTPTTDMRFRNREEYEQWLEQNKLKKISNPAYPKNDKISQIQGPKN